MDDNEWVSGDFIVLALAVSIYFVPTIVAAVRRHPRGRWIATVNFFLGWTLFGWFVAFGWAIEDRGPKRPDT